MNTSFAGFNGITSAQIARRFTGSTGPLTVGANGRDGAQACTVGDGARLRLPTNSTDATLFAGISYYPTSSISSGRSVLDFMNIADAAHCRLTIDSSRILRVLNAAGATVYTHSEALTLNTWYFIELGVVINSTTGRAILRINATEVYDSGATLNTQSGASAVATYIQTGDGFITHVVDAMYVNDSTGSLDTSFWGIFVVGVANVAANDSVAFTPLSSTNVSNIDDGNTPDDDTTYNSSDTVGHRDLFTVSGYTAPEGTILSVAVRSLMRAEDVGPRGARAVLRSSSTDALGTAVALTTSYAEAPVYASTDPATSARFANDTAVNALRVGYEIAS